MSFSYSALGRFASIHVPCPLCLSQEGYLSMSHRHKKLVLGCGECRGHARIRPAGGALALTGIMTLAIEQEIRSRLQSKTLTADQRARAERAIDG